MTVQFNLNYTQISELEQKMIQLPEKMEEVINKTLHFDGIKIARNEITDEMPVSRQRGRFRHKNHAKMSNWSKSEKHNLGFTIKTKGGAANRSGSFGYLVFPNEGRGPHNPLEQRFMEKGLENAVPKILNKLHQNIDKVLEEEM